MSLINFRCTSIVIYESIFQEVSITRRLRHVCDSVIKLEAFAGSDKEQNPAFKEYHGKG